MTRERGSGDSWAGGEPIARHSTGAFGLIYHAPVRCTLALVFGGIAAAFLMMNGHRGIGVFWSLVAVSLAGAGVVSYARTIRSVAVFDEGLTWGPGGVQKATWEEIEHFRRDELIITPRGGGPGSTYRQDMAIGLEDGREAVFPMGLADWKGLADRIQGEVTARKWPKALESYEAGRAVAFGELAVARDGITFKGKHIPWDTVLKVGVHNGWLSVAERGNDGSHGISLSAVPNFPVLLRLLAMSPAGLN